MRKHLIFVLFTIGLLAAVVPGCKKDKVELPKYELSFVSESEHFYELEVAGRKDVVMSKNVRMYTLEKGTYSWKVTQLSGYLGLPNTQRGSVFLNEDKTIYFGNDGNGGNGGNDNDKKHKLRFTSTSSNPYELQVAGYNRVIQGNTYVDYTLPEGIYSWRVEQMSGYVIYPTIKEGTVILNQDKEVVFP